MLQHLLTKRGIQMIPVTKGVAGDAKILEVLQSVGFDSVAESRLSLIDHKSDIHYMMIKGASPNEVTDVVDLTSVSIQTERATIQSLNEGAIEKSVIHPILIMVDWKDGREGALAEEVIEMVQDVQQLDGIRLLGLAFNFMCFRPLPPTHEDIERIHQFIMKVEAESGVQFEIISGGNSSMLSLMMTQDLGRINQLRIGETWLRGYETSYNERVPQLYEDAFLLEGRIIEIKPRYDIESNETYMQALVDIGQLDTNVNGLTVVDDHLKIIGSTSDILLVDLGMTDYYQLGDRIIFQMSYNAIAQSMHMPYLTKHYTHDDGIEALIDGFKSTKIKSFSK